MNKTFFTWMTSETLEHMEKAFNDLIRYAEAQDQALRWAGKGLGPQSKTGSNVVETARGWIRVIQRAKQDAALDELARMAQEDGLL